MSAFRVTLPGGGHHLAVGVRRVRPDQPVHLPRPHRHLQGSTYPPGPQLPAGGRVMAETDIRSPGWVPSGLPPAPIDERKVRAAAFEDIETSRAPTVVQRSPLAARLRQEADQIAERRDAVAVLEAPRGPVPGKRREWSEADKARIVSEAGRDGGRVVMARYQLAGSVLNRWIRDARAARKTTPPPVVPKAERSEPAPDPDLTRPAWAVPEAESPDDALGAAIGHLRWHRDHVAAKLAKIDAALAALEELSGEAS